MKRINKQTLSAMVLLSVLVAGASAADIAVIVNKGNDNEITKTMVEKIYLGETAQWSSGGSIALLDLPEDSANRADFTSRLLSKSVPATKALWAVKLFSGRATPPKVQGSDEDVKRVVAGNKNAMGYIKASSVDGSVKVVVTLK